MADAHDEFPSLAVTQYWFFGGFTKMIVEVDYILSSLCFELNCDPPNRSP
jgi:hypothetical protein